MTKEDVMTVPQNTTNRTVILFNNFTCGNMQK